MNSAVIDDKTHCEYYLTDNTAEIQSVDKQSKHWNRWAILMLNEAHIKYTSFKLLNLQ